VSDPIRVTCPACVEPAEKQGHAILCPTPGCENHDDGFALRMAEDIARAYDDEAAGRAWAANREMTRGGRQRLGGGPHEGELRPGPGSWVPLIGDLGESLL
jgi:hypothetical protein